MNSSGVSSLVNIGKRAIKRLTQRTTKNEEDIKDLQAALSDLGIGDNSLQAQIDSAYQSIEALQEADTTIGSGLNELKTTYQQFAEDTASDIQGILASLSGPPTIDLMRDQISGLASDLADLTNEVYGTQSKSGLRVLVDGSGNNITNLFQQVDTLEQDTATSVQYLMDEINGTENTAGLKNRMQQAETANTNQYQLITSLENNTSTALSTLNNEIYGTIDSVGLKTSVSDIQLDITNIYQQITALENSTNQSDITQLQSTVTALYNDVHGTIDSAGLLNRMQQSETANTNQYQLITALDNEVTTLQSDLQLLSSDLSSVSATAQGAQSAIGGFSDILSNTQDLTYQQVVQQVIDNSASITQLQADVTQDQSDITALFAGQTAQSSTNTSVQTSLSTLSAAQTAQASTNTALQSSITTLESSVQGILSMPLNDIYFVTPMQDDISSLTSRVEALETQILYSVAPIGSILILCSTIIPQNYFVCDGRTFSAEEYPALAAALGSTTVPNLKGYFLRGLDTAASVDPDGASRLIGSVQTSENKSHSHVYNDVSFMAGGTSWTNQTGSANNDGDNHPWWRTTNNTLTNNAADATINLPTSSVGATESRPINKAVHYIIRAY